MSEHIFYVKANIVGPYLPENNQVIENYQFINEIIDDEAWEDGPDGLKTTPSEGSSGISLSYEIITQGAAEIMMKIKKDTLSSRIAKKIAEEQVKKICAILSITVPGCRYFYKIGKVKMVPDSTANSNTESPLSKPVFGLSYSKRAIEDAQVDFIKIITDKLTNDPMLLEVINYFSSALEAEFYHSVLDEKAILYYFKIIELISPKILVKFRLSQSQKDIQFESLITTLTSDFQQQKPLADKLKNLRDAFSTVKQIDGSIISENIKSAAIKMGFNEDGIKRLEKLIKIRNEIIAHASANKEHKIELEDNRDFREIAKMFIKYYVFMSGVKIEQINRINPTKEVGGWYMISYIKSG